jgi:polysaccharide biosynthesis transport protein
MTLHQFLLLLQARWRIALFIPLVAILAALAVSLMLPKKYTAQTAVLVDIRSPDPVAGVAVSGVVAPSYMADGHAGGHHRW